MWRPLLLLLCIHSQVSIIHTAHNGDTSGGHVEKKAMERENKHISDKIVKRSAGENAVGGVDINNTGSTQGPLNVVDYISSQQTGQDSSVSVLQLEGTTEPMNNIVTNTGHVTTAEQILQTNTGIDIVTESQSTVESSTQPSINKSVEETVLPTTSVSSTLTSEITTNSTDANPPPNEDFTTTISTSTVLSSTLSSSTQASSNTDPSESSTHGTDSASIASSTTQPITAPSTTVNTTTIKASSSNTPFTTSTTSQTQPTTYSPATVNQTSTAPGALSTNSSTQSVSISTSTVQATTTLSTVTNSEPGTTSTTSTVNLITSSTHASTSIFPTTLSPVNDSDGDISLSEPEPTPEESPNVTSTTPRSENDTSGIDLVTHNTTRTSEPAQTTTTFEDGKVTSTVQPMSSTTTLTTDSTTTPQPAVDSTTVVTQTSPTLTTDLTTSKPEPEIHTPIVTTQTPSPEPENYTTSPKTSMVTTTLEPTTSGVTTTLEPTTTTVTTTLEPTTSMVTTTIEPTTSMVTTEPQTSTISPDPQTSVHTAGHQSSTPTAEPETYTSSPEPEEYTPKSEPEDYTPESEPEDYTPKSEPEDYTPKSEPEDHTPTDVPVEAEPEFNFDVFAEPGPDWPVAKEEWKQAWEFHIYFFGVLFVLLGIYCLFCVIQMWKMDHLLSRHYFMTLLMLVMLICVFRASYLLIDAYNSSGTFPVVLDYFLYSTVFPCLTAVFSILFYALLLAIRVRVISEKVQKLWVLMSIIGFHFALSFVTDILVGLFSTAAVMLLICQAFFILWGLVIFVGYLVIFKRLYKSAISRQEALRRSSTHERKNNITQGFQEKLPRQKYRLGLAVKVTLVSSFFGLACVCFELYGMLGVYGVMRVEKPKPWPWWIYHFIVRCLEIAMCSSIAYVASQPLKYSFKKKYKDNVCLKALPCRYLCCADISSHHDDFGNVSLDQYAVSETDHLGWLKKIKLKKFSSPDTSAPYPPHTAEKYSDPDATLLVRKINKPKPSMLVVEDGFVRIKRDDEMIPGNQYDIDNVSRTSSDVNNTRVSPRVSHTVNETQRHAVDTTRTSEGVANAGFAQEDTRTSLQDDIRMSFHGDMDADNDIADETDIDIAVTDCENSDGYDTPVPESDDNLGNSGDIFRPLSDIDLAASMESELERAFPPRHGDGSGRSHKKIPNKGSKTYKKSPTGSNIQGQSHTDDDWSDSSDGACRTPESGLLRRPIRRCKSAESKEEQTVRTFDKNRYLSLSSMDSVGKNEIPTTEL